MLREEVNRRLIDRFGDDLPLDVVVCSDVWRLNDESISTRPTISIGGPGVNALSAFLGDKLSSVFVVEDQLRAVRTTMSRREQGGTWAAAAASAAAKRLLPRRMKKTGAASA